MKKMFMLLVSSLLILTSCKENVKAQEDDKTDIVQEDEFKKSNDFKFYHSRGISKGNSKDYKGAISDFTRAIDLVVAEVESDDDELDPTFLALTHYARGI